MKSALVALLIFSAIVFSGCTEQPNGAPPGAQPPAGGQSVSVVQIQNSSFSPAEITVTKGMTVTWVNLDTTPHTVAGGSEFSSGTLSMGQSFRHKFDNAGTFDYSCGIHPSMKGKVIVQ